MPAPQRHRRLRRNFLICPFGFAPNRYSSIDPHAPPVRLYTEFRCRSDRLTEVGSVGGDGRSMAGGASWETDPGHRHVPDGAYHRVGARRLMALTTTIARRAVCSRYVRQAPAGFVMRSRDCERLSIQPPAALAISETANAKGPRCVILVQRVEAARRRLRFAAG